jgi:hypothetical protein
VRKPWTAAAGTPQSVMACRRSEGWEVGMCPAGHAARPAWQTQLVSWGQRRHGCRATRAANAKRGGAQAAMSRRGAR